MAKNPAWMPALKLDPAHQISAAIDSRALIMPSTGLLRGKRATTYPSPDMQEALTALGAEVVSEHLVVEGNVATGAQCLAGVDLAAWVIERLRGPAAGTRPRSRTSGRWHAEGAHPAGGPWQVEWPGPSSGFPRRGVPERAAVTATRPRQCAVAHGHAHRPTKLPSST